VPTRPLPPPHPPRKAHALAARRAGVSGLPAGRHQAYAECLQNGELEHEAQWVIDEHASRDVLRLELPALTPGYHTIGIAIVRSSSVARDDADQEPLLAMRKLTIEVVEFEPIYDQTAVHFECAATRVFEHAGASTGPEDPEHITLASIASIDRATQILHLAAAWDGPVSVAFYARTELELDALVELVTQVIMVLSRARAQAIIVEIFCMCSDKRPAAHADEASARPQSAVFEFPINMLRFAAVKNARTHRVLPLDADFLPSHNAHALLKAAYRSTATGGAAVRDKDFLVLPCFLTTDDSPWPEPAHLRADSRQGLRLELGAPLTKARLRASYAAGHAAPPGAPFSLHTHGATDYVRWIATDADSVTYPVEYNLWYEPYGVVNKTAWPGPAQEGMFDTRFVGYGGDKVAWAHEAAVTFPKCPLPYTLSLPLLITVMVAMGHFR